MELDLLPPDLAGQVQALQEYEWTSSEARQAFDELMDELRSQLMQSYFNQMSSSMSDVSPESLQRMKDMFNELNRMLETRAAGGDTDRMFQEFMDRFGDMVPGNPQSLDELLEQMAQQMAAMQQLLNSMSPEQRAQLEQLANSLLEDMDLRWQVERLGGNLRQAFPQAGWDRNYDFSGSDPLGFAEAASVMNQLGDMDRLEQMMTSATNPGALAEVDIDPSRRAARRGCGQVPGSAGQAGPTADRRRPHGPKGGPPRADPPRSAQDRPERLVRPVLEADQGPHGPPRGRPHRDRSRAHVRNQAL